MDTPTKSYAELEVALHRTQADAYEVELRFSHPHSEAEVAPERGLAALDPARLLALHNDPRAYGECLAEQLFAADNVRSLYLHARTAVASADVFLRLRLLVASSAPELQALRWELLLDPESKAPLATSEKTLFSRFMVSRDWRPVQLRPRSELGALVAVAAPSNLASYGLAEVDLEGEVGRARDSLQGIRVTVAGEDQPLTPRHLVEGLRAGVDILYLVCHGAIHRKSQAPILYLQKDDGEVGVAQGTDLAQQISELAQPPRLVVLASCESGGKEEAADAEGRPAVQASLAPRLAEAGVPAVLAMQGKISMETVKRAMPVFFKELLEDGQIDRAMAVARAAVRDRDDGWMPALYLRLKGGRIWYVPGFGGDDDDLKWSSIISNILQGNFVPILGPDVGERVHGTSRELAESLALEHGFPMAPFQRKDLAKVAQYLSIHESPKFARNRYLKGIRKQIKRRHPDLDFTGTDVKTMFKTVVRHRYQDETDPLRILAELGGPVYVNANPDPMLPLALAEIGAKPKPLFCDWRKTRDNHPTEPPYKGTPTAMEPIVYYAFGFLAKGETVVLTEDDFVDYLIAAAENKLIPRVVRSALVKSSLLFLGFSLDDLSFRVLFRLIMSLEGSSQLRDFAHVGVQIDPAEHEMTDVDQARKYLQAYFGRDVPPIDIYWGSPIDFLNDLRAHIEKAPEETMLEVDDEDDEDDWVSF